MILSDRTIREQLAAGRIAIEPLDDSCIQPSSVDLRLDKLFRVFLNHTMSVIDVRKDLSDLTQEVEIADGDAFILHPGEFVLGSTSEKISLPDDIVARIEGKSSLGRLGLLIHSSLPGSETVLVLDGDRLVPTPIEDVVRKQRRAMVAAFDPDTFEVGYHRITGWYEGPPDRIYEVELASGRRVRVTAGHNLFTLDRSGRLAKVRTGELQPGVRVAIPRVVPDPAPPTPGPATPGPAPGRAALEPRTDGVSGTAPAAPEVRMVDHVPDPAPVTLSIAGPTVHAAFAAQGDMVAGVLRAEGYAEVAHHRSRATLPYAVAAQIPGLLDALGRDDVVAGRDGRDPLPARFVVDADRAWLLGLYLADGHRRAHDVASDPDQAIRDRAASALLGLGVTVDRGPEGLVAGSSALAALLEWLGAGGDASTCRVPAVVFGWPGRLVEAFIDGVVAGGDSTGGGRTSLRTTSPGLVADLLLLFARLGRPAASCRLPARGTALPRWQVDVTGDDDPQLTVVPRPDELLESLREAGGLTQADAATCAGDISPADLDDVDRRRGPGAVTRADLGRLRDVYAGAVGDDEARRRLDRLVDGDLLWDEVVAVHDTGTTETIYDLEVRPGGRKIENFLAGSGGVFVSNTAGFIDAGFSGHITLELSNVANLPITLYPGMKIGQVSFLQMTTPADVPYGSAKVGSKYQGQRGPTPSRYWENFDDSAADGG